MNYRNKRFAKKPTRATPSNKKIINGQVINLKNNPEKYRTLKATRDLTQNKAASFSADGNSSIEALNLLESIGCSIADKLDANFSLIEAQTDNETLMNPNISGSQNPKNRKKLDTTKSFPNVDDPFYEVDVGRGELEREKKATNRRNEAGAKTLRLASDIAMVNTNRKYNSTLKQFKRPSRTSPRPPRTSGHPIKYNK